MDEYSKYKSYLEGGIVQTEILNPKSTFMICSYWWGLGRVNKNSTKGLTYDKQVERLIEQCRKSKVNYYFVRYPVFEQKGMYQTALGLKGEFIMKCLDELPKYKVIYIDTDLQILRYPHLFDIDADCYFLNWNEYDTECYNPYQVELPGGILGFANTYNSKALLSILNKYMIKNLHLAEDKSFSGIISRHFMNTYLRCVWLPYNYMYMFSKHKYDPSIGKYTHIANYKEELKGENYKYEDLVMVHEDFETGALDDVFAQRVGKVSRWPPNAYRQFGEKLRCIDDVKFNNYMDFNMNKKQLRHLRVDFKEKQQNKYYKNKYITKLSKKSLKCKLYSKLIKGDSRYIVVSLCDNNTSKITLNMFKKNCEKIGVDYVIYNSGENSYNKVNKPVLFNYVLGKYKRNIAYIDINTKIKRDPKLFNVKNMDFMTINLDNTNIKSSVCSDMRILKTLNDNLYFFAYNSVVLDFMNIWLEYNKYMKYQHKSLEYAFNVSLAINKMRCYWLPREYVLGPIMKYSSKSLFFNNKYSEKDSKIRKLTRDLRQCGIKPALKDGDVLRTHHYGSLHGSIYHNKYGKLFLEF
jgi:hypothetical protein